MLFTVSVELPVFAIFKVRCELDPTVTFPNAKSPLKEMTRVGAVAVVNDQTSPVVVPALFLESMRQ
jgi:hypothetical protein